MPTTLIFTCLILGLAVVLALLIGGWGPAPIVALAFLVFIAPGLLAGWFLYRRRVSRGEIPPLGAEARGDASSPSATRRQADADQPEHKPVA
jgi:hypothetical protein